MNKVRNNPILFAVFLVLSAAVLRILRDAGIVVLPPNVAPVAALALFGGAMLPRKLSYVLPIAAMFASDLVIGFYNWPIMASVYGSFVLLVVIGNLLRKRTSVTRVLGASLAGSLLFFLVTNAAVWAFDRMYPHTWSGLVQSYVAGLPFFRNTVFGDLGFVAVMFGSYGLAVYLMQRKSAAAVPI